MHLIAARQHAARLLRRRDDTGLTLVEVLMSVTILGIITSALFGVVLLHLQTTSDTRARLNESTDQQFISTYWQNDVSSLGRRSLNSTSTQIEAAPSVFVGSPGPGDCGDAVGSVVVAFAWNEFKVNAGDPADAWNTTPQEVAYVTVPSAGRFALQRVRCKNGLATSTQTVAHNLMAVDPVTAVTCDTTCGSSTLPNRVSLTFTVKDSDNHPRDTGYTTTVSADRRQT